MIHSVQVSASKIDISLGDGICRLGDVSGVDIGHGEFAEAVELCGGSDGFILPEMIGKTFFFTFREGSKTNDIKLELREDTRGVVTDLTTNNAMTVTWRLEYVGMLWVKIDSTDYEWFWMPLAESVDDDHYIMKTLIKSTEGTGGVITTINAYAYSH
ncbi:hypothetical protein [Vibrio barjaei]|uniref:hypothetical protein n=1 Tax=Vibrio barjaei TaxID=1676683 RepID=UPI0022839E9D|nr:hypothetical protein [Vibrio barjaei]MCY9870369.1 hypothetical protein [Vibrio barjaei]